jgi:hypothetical protein
MREEAESPLLWSRIETSLKERAVDGARMDSLWQRLRNWRPVSIGWQTVLAGAMVLALAVSGGYLYIHRENMNIGKENSSLLKSPALREVEKSERNYEQAIEHLEAEAKPQLQSGDSPLVASYREKLMILDGAIDELRTEAGQNPSNAHLRRQLLAMYREKQQTLQDVLEINR